MEKKTASAIMLTLLLTSMLTLAFNIQPVKAEGTIYIRADGSIDPSTAPISSADNVTYTLTGNINDSIVVERNNTIIEGAGYRIQGSGGAYSQGLTISGTSNVTIKNTNIEGYAWGIVLSDSSDTTLSENNMTNNGVGIEIRGPSNHNSVSNNNITANYWYGITLSGSFNCISDNNIVANGISGVVITGSSNNVLRNNHINMNRYNLWVVGEEVSHFLHDIDSSNTVDGRPVYYWVNRKNESVPADAGYVALVNSTNITVEKLILQNNGNGILLANTTNSIITSNNIRGNAYGICLYYSSNNTISGNNATANYWIDVQLEKTSNNNQICGNNITNSQIGISLHLYSSYNSISNNIIEANICDGIRLGHSSNNAIFHNSFVNNPCSTSFSLMNAWDDGYPSGGNYWSDYTDVDLNSDGIWDHPYVIDVNNQDRYPLVNPWTPTPTIRYVIPTAIIKVRSYPGIPENNANVITKLPKGSVLQIVGHPDNGKFVDGYHWWYVKFGIVKGWVAEEYVKEYDFQKQQPKTLNDVSLTAYHVCYEGEMAEGPTVINPPKISGAFYKKFLYSAKGVVMQGSGRAIDGRVIKYVNGGGGWVNQEGQRTYLRNDYTWSNGPPYWIANEESVTFEELPENTYKGAYWDIYPWYSIATDPKVIPPGTTVYISELDGLRLSNGETLNGYFVAADTGGAITGNRIDVFVGAGDTALLDWPGNFKANIKYDDSTAWKRIQAKEKCPGELRVYDSQGNVTGVVNGEIKIEIPNSSYDYVDNSVTIVFPNDSYRYVIVGTSEGLYDLTVTSITEQDVVTFVAVDIPTSANATHQYSIDWEALSVGGEGVTIEVDSDGDGMFEHTFASDSELTQSEFLAQTAPPPLSASIGPLSASILVGQSVTFTSTVSGGYAPYAYQWCLNSNPVSGATSPSWTFTPTTSGIYYVHLRVTDAKANTAQSAAARIAVATVPVGGYSIPIKQPATAQPILPYIALIATLTVIFTKLRPKTKRKR